MPGLSWCAEIAAMNSPRLAVLAVLQVAPDGGVLASMLANMPADERRKVETVADERGPVVAAEWLRTMHDDGPDECRD